MDKPIKLELDVEQAELLMTALLELSRSDSGSPRERQERYRQCRGLHDLIEDAVDEVAGGETD